MAEHPRSGRRAALLAALVAILFSMFGPARAAQADPGDINEGGTKALSEALEEASRVYYEARSLLAASQKRQAEITKTLRQTELSLLVLGADVTEIASARYMGSQLGVLNGLFTGQGDPSNLLRGAALAEYLVWRDDERLHRYRVTLDDAKRQQELINAEIAIQREQLDRLDKQKRAAEKALAAVGGMVTSGYTGPVQPAQPARRNPDGSWPRETCSINDPSPAGATFVPGYSGCVTPRTFHALAESVSAGARKGSLFFNCWRAQSWGEHPRGRACDFAVSTGRFGGAATGADRTYGNQLAAWFRTNAEPLGVLYVIWYRQIWMPGIGWRAYSGYGDPSSEHTNHVHLSML